MRIAPTSSRPLAPLARGRRSRAAAALSGTSALALLLVACSSATPVAEPPDDDLGSTDAGGDSSTGPARDGGLPAPSRDGGLPTPSPDGGSVVVDAGACKATLQAQALLPGSHVSPGTSGSIAWNSNPPSSGPHYPTWAAYRTYDHPVDPGYWVHDLEHGGIDFLYKCDAGDCAAIPAAFQRVIDKMPDDPLCSGKGVRVRALIVPDPDLEVPIAAAAWGFTYTSTCLDEASLLAFALEHYGKGPESLCDNGQDLE